MKKTPSIIIEPTNQKEAVIEIAKNLPDFFTATGVESLARDLGTGILFGALTGDELVGFIVLRRADIGSLEISWLAVSEKMQGLGIGSRLVRESLEKLTTEGFSVCYVKTLAETVDDEGYAKTRKFYKSLSFHTLEIIDPYPGWENGNPCQILAASLPLV